MPPSGVSNETLRREKASQATDARGERIAQVLQALALRQLEAAARRPRLDELDREIPLDTRRKLAML